MRDIKFRGKRTDSGEWAFGNLIVTSDVRYIIQPWIRTEGVGYTHPNAGVVDPETVGQYTGLKDKNGVEIYVGDTWREPDGTEHLVEYKEMFAGYVPFATDGGCGCCAHRMGLDPKSGEVIGNIHDNPELLGGIR